MRASNSEAFAFCHCNWCHWYASLPWLFHAKLTRCIGINGSAIVRHLLKNESYDKIYSLSQSNPGYKHSENSTCLLGFSRFRRKYGRKLPNLSQMHPFLCLHSPQRSRRTVARKCDAFEKLPPSPRRFWSRQKKLNGSSSHAA